MYCRYFIVLAFDNIEEMVTCIFVFNRIATILALLLVAMISLLLHESAVRPRTRLVLKQRYMNVVGL